MWPYNNYNRNSWDRYYSQSHTGRDQRQMAITSGIAAAFTVGVFFTVFLLTFGCRILYHRRRERQQRSAAEDAAPRLSLDDQQRMFVCSCASTALPPPLPSYESALKMPTLAMARDSGQPSPPPFHAPFQLPTKMDQQIDQQAQSTANQNADRHS